MSCPACGSARVKPFTYKPPVTGGRGMHKCTAECVRTGRLCLNCRLVTG